MENYPIRLIRKTPLQTLQRIFEMPVSCILNSDRQLHNEDFTGLALL